MSDRFDKILEVLDGHDQQRSGESGLMSTGRGACWRCSAEPVTELGACVPCTEWLRGERDDDPAASPPRIYTVGAPRVYMRGEPIPAASFDLAVERVAAAMGASSDEFQRLDAAMRDIARAFRKAPWWRRALVRALSWIPWKRRDVLAALAVLNHPRFREEAE